MSHPALRVQDLSVALPGGRGRVRAVSGVSLDAERGAMHGIVGESGSGKSTLLRAILGLLPTGAEMSGEIETAGRAGIIFQEPMTALNPVMRVGDQIAEAPRHVLGRSRAAAAARALELMRQVGIPDPERRMKAYPHELSGGLRQRVLIAIALSSEPAVLLADEPTTALDVTIQDQILRLLRRIAEETGVAIVLVTHDLAVVSRICATLSVMYAGRFVETGSTRAVLEEPRHPYTAGLLRAVPDPSRGTARLNAIPGLPPDLAALPAGCAFRPRCALAIDICASARPPLEQAGEGRAAACYRKAELVAEAVS